MLVLGGVIGAAVYVGCALAYLQAGARGDLLVVAWWVSGLAVLGFAVSACMVEDDGIERPRYLASVVSGLRNEWRHTGRGSAPRG